MAHDLVARPGQRSEDPGHFPPSHHREKGAFTSYRPRMWMGVWVFSLPWVAVKDKEQTLSIRSTG